MNDRNAIRVAVIGAGPAAQMLHFPVLAALHRHGEIALTCVCDIDGARAEAARSKFGFQTSASDAAAVATSDGVDAVYIFGSAAMHHRYGILALEHAKHLFVEKPIAPNYAAAMQMSEVAAARQLIAVGGHNRRFYKGLAIMQARCGRAGWTFAEVFAHKPEFGKPPLFGASSWLTANGIHALDALVFMMGGLPQEMAASANHNTATYAALMQWQNGARATFSCNNSAGVRREAFVFHAPDETCHLENEQLVIHARGKATTTAMAMIEGGFAAEHAEFLGAIRGDMVPRHALAKLAPSLYLAEQIENGFRGVFALPSRTHFGSTGPRFPAVQEKAVLVVQAGPLQGALSRLPSNIRLLSPQDVMRSPMPFPQVQGVLLGRGAAALDDAILDKLPNLAVVGVMGLSLARYEPARLLARGIALVHSSEAYAETVADFAFALAVLGRRRAFLSNEWMRRGGWGTSLPPSGPKNLLRLAAKHCRPYLASVGLNKAASTLWKRAKPMLEGPGGTDVAHDLSGTRVGLIGWSTNARAFAERLMRAGATVRVYSEHASAASLGAVAPATMAEVLSADIVSLHRGLTPKTYHFLGKAELDRLRPGALLINIARGALIAPDALLTRLQRGDIFACLDTFEVEPPSKFDALRRLPNVFLTAHIAGGSPEMHAAAAEEVVAKVVAWLDGDDAVAIPPGKLQQMS